MTLRSSFPGRQRPPRRARAGFTILEIMISMTMLLAIVGAALTLYRGQTRTIAQQARRLDALANAQYVTGTIERELRIAGVGLAPGQPVLVAATPTSVVFNTNLLSRDSTDVTAVYVDVNADPLITGAFPVAARMLLPGQTADVYPDSTYRLSNGEISRAETIAFWFSRDSTATDATEHVLYRRVNSAPAEVVARGILISPTDTVFEFLKADTLDRLFPIPRAMLPLTHVAASHLAGSDTGRFAMIDSIRVVRVRVRAVARAPGMPASVRRAESTIRILNAGMAGGSTCGTQPLSPGSLTAVLSGPAGARTVTLTWPASIDEAGGERDVMRYAIYRRTPSGASSAWDEPITSIPAAGQSTYTYVDNAMTRGQDWEYGVTAQDCTPSNSPVAKSAALHVP